MGFSYDVAQGDDVSKVRFLIQDTVDTRIMFQDEEIQAVVDREANVFVAAAEMCDVIVMRTGSGRGGIKRKRVSDLDITYDTNFFTGLAMRLRARGAGHQVPYAGGVSRTDKDAQKADSDWVAPSFPRGLQDNPTASKVPQPSTSTDPLSQV